MTRPKYVDVYWKLIENSGDGKIRYKCNVCPQTERIKSGTSWSNLYQHTSNAHPDYEEQIKKVEAGGTLDVYVDYEGKRLHFEH